MPDGKENSSPGINNKVHKTPEEDKASKLEKRKNKLRSECIDIIM